MMNNKIDKCVNEWIIYNGEYITEACDLEQLKKSLHKVIEEEIDYMEGVEFDSNSIKIIKSRLFGEGKGK